MKKSKSQSKQKHQLFLLGALTMNKFGMLGCTERVKALKGHV
jgi:hypothetical protein